jgi:hypothetical protein
MIRRVIGKPPPRVKSPCLNLLRVNLFAELISSAGDVVVPGLSV